MAKYRVVAMFKVRKGTDDATRFKIKRFFLYDFVPAETGAPGLLSIEICTPYPEAITHVPVNSAYDYALVELWDSPESNHAWWGDDILHPPNKELERAMIKFEQDIMPHIDMEEGFKDCHFNVNVGHTIYQHKIL